MNTKTTSTGFQVTNIVSATLASMPISPLLLVLWAGRGGGKTTFLNRLKEQLASEKGILPLGPWDARTGPWDALASQILAAVQESPTGSRKLVLIDNLDELLRTDDEGEPFFAFERQALHRLVERGDTLVVATSRVPLVQWRDCDVRIAAQNHHIPPLSREEAAEWARARGLDPEQAFALSLGHPQVLAWLEAQPDLSQEEIDQRITALFLDSLSERACQLAEVASLLPIFDLPVLRPLLFSEEDGESFYSEYIELLEELIQAGLVAWDGEVGAYRFREGTVRCLLARGLRRRDPDRFYHIHRVAADHYRQEAERAAYLHRVLVSALYHTAWVDSGEACVRWIEESLGLWMNAPWEKVLTAWETGAGDAATREELWELLGPAAYGRITRLLESAAQTAAQLFTPAQEVNR